MFGHGEVAVRLPSTLAMVATLLITFDCARRLTDGLHGLIAMAIAAWPLAGEGFEARSYAIYVMFAALALWVWTYTGASEKIVGNPIWSDSVPRGLLSLLCGATPRTLCGVGDCPLEAVATSLPEAYCRDNRSRHPRRSPITFHLILLPKFAPGFWSRPSLRDLTEIYSHIYSPVCLSSR